MWSSSHSKGITLPEVMMAVVIVGIVTIGFSSSLMYTNNMRLDSKIRTMFSQDTYILDKYVRDNLTEQIADSMEIYVDTTAESGGSASSVGTIIRTVLPDSTIERVLVENGQLVWEIDSSQHEPVDANINQLRFEKYSGYRTDMLLVNATLIQGDDSLALEWKVCIRN